MCSDVDKSIAHTLQSILNRLDKDCDLLVDKIEETLQTDSANGTHNMKAHSWVSLFANSSDTLHSTVGWFINPKYVQIIFRHSLSVAP